MTRRQRIAATPVRLLHRRHFLYGLGATLGTVAFNALLRPRRRDRQRRASQPSGPLAPKPPHHAAKAKACIFLFLEGGPSHIDTFDPKPELDKLHMQEFMRQDKFASAMASGKRYYVKSPFQFRQVGEVGDRIVRTLSAPGARGRRTVRLSRLHGRIDQSSHGLLPHEHGQPVRRRSGGRSLDHVRTGHRESESAGLRRAAGSGLPARRLGQLVQRFPAGLLPGHDAAPHRFADSRPAPPPGVPPISSVATWTCWPN